MLFPEQEDRRTKVAARTVYIYENGKSDQKPISMNLVRKKSSLKDIARIFKFSHIRIYNSEGSQYFDQDIDFIQNQSVLYVSRGEEFDPASCFAEYQILKLLGQGGYGKVFLAQHKQTGKSFAIKIIKTQNIGSVNDIDSIFVEAEILKSLKHQNIVEVHKCLTMKNMEVVIIMEYLQGGDLLKYVTNLQHLSQETARTFIRQVVKGILYCHKNNLTHRDLKLENLLLVNSEEKKIKIIDFGIAGAITNMKWEQLDTGSLNYMAPECFMVHKNFRFDGKIDVWAIGVILYAMLCGQLPFKGQYICDTIQSIKAGVYKIRSALKKSLSQACLDFLEKCLQTDPKTRISIEDLSNHKWLDDGFYNQHKKKEIEVIAEQEMEEVEKIIEKVKDISNQPRRQSLEDTKRKTKSSSKSIPKKKTVFTPQPKKSSFLKAQIPKSRFR